MRTISGKVTALSVIIILLLVLEGCNTMSDSEATQSRIMLCNGQDLTGFVTFPDPIDTQQTWSVRDNVIYCNGNPTGYLRTELEYSNYHLHVEWRWPGEAGNSGVLVHAIEPDNVWPVTYECQLQSGNAGTIVLMGGTGLSVDGQSMANPNRRFSMINMKEESSENPLGQWNSYDIYCEADMIKLYVNDVLQNEGTDATQTSGFICFQSEGTPIEFRNMYIEELSSSD